MRNRIELVKRYILFFVGLWANALGVALIAKACLGAGPTTCIPYVLSIQWKISFGTTTFLFNMLLLFAQVILLRKQFKKVQLLQIPVSFLFAAFIDLAVLCCSFIPVNNYAVAIFVVVIGSAFRALGVSCQVLADVVMLSSEAFIKAISDAFHFEFSIVKLISDGIMTVTAFGMSLVLLGNLDGVREGTILSALLVAPISRMITERLGFATHILENEGRFVYETKFKLNEKHPLVITISSESGSGGRKIAKILSEKLEIPVYDKDLVDMIAKEGNFTKEYVKRHNEKIYTNPIEEFFGEYFSFTDNDLESFRALFDAQSKVITNIANEQACIIIGHCSNYLLKGLNGCLHVHICADMEHRIQYMKEKYRISNRDAVNLIHRQDRDVDQYYAHFAGINWKEAVNYHITLDSSVLGYDATAEIIEELAKKKYS